MTRMTVDVLVVDVFESAVGAAGAPPLGIVAADLVAPVPVAAPVATVPATAAVAAAVPVAGPVAVAPPAAVSVAAA